MCIALIHIIFSCVRNCFKYINSSHAYDCFDIEWCMGWSNEQLMRSQEGYLGVYVTTCEASERMNRLPKQHIH